jgi:hypothetical protein
VEFIAPAEYMVRPPQPPVYLFIIDVSYSAVGTGMLATAIRALRESLDNIPNNDRRTKFGLITVDSSLHFYNLNVAHFFIIIFIYSTKKKKKKKKKICAFCFFMFYYYYYFSPS